MARMMTYVFPGQGAQRKGMGGELFDEFAELTSQADEILGYSIKTLCLEDPQSHLNQTQYTQPALYTVNALTYYNKIVESGRTPNYTAGHSLGEYNALLAAGVFDFRTGLLLVQKRGELMSRAEGGAMAAIIGLSERQLMEALSENRLDRIDIANLNSPAQIVISGPKAEIDRARHLFDGMKEVKSVVPLRTSGAFHSRYMKEAAEEFGDFLHAFDFEEPVIPVIANTSARPYRYEEIRRNLRDQITSSVKWTESIRYLLGRGEMEFEEIGGGRILTGLIQQIRTEAGPLVTEEERVGMKPADAGGTASYASAGVITVPAAPVVSRAPLIERLAVDEPSPAGLGSQTPAWIRIKPANLGSPEFRRDYGLTYAYISGAMYKGIASKEMVVRMGKAGMMGFFGAGGLKMQQIEEAIRFIQGELLPGQAYGMNLVHEPAEPHIEESMVDLFLRTGVKVVEAAAFMTITPALVKYRAKGLKRDENGKVTSTNKIIAKLSRPEVAEAFLSPAPERITAKLLEEGKITREEASLLAEIAVADDLCAEADSGGHTDGAVAYALMPAILKLRDEMMEKHRYAKKVRVGAAGGIGTPDAALAAFSLGADFIVTGSINQCTVEANTSPEVKDLLEQMNVQDTEYAPAGDMFEMGAKVQVLKKGLFFPARANKLYDLYRQYNAVEDIDEKTKAQLQDKYFKRSLQQVYDEVRSYHPPHVIEKAERNPKIKMALIFKWYFAYSTRLALSGNPENKVDYQIQCGPALGAFNQWVKGTELESWRNRHVDEIALRLMNATAELLNRRYQSFVQAAANE
ncbi:ACP S-malonyltransferase [Paenibacillus mucilaginosus]|uniref:[acyl-carrier-protein] S-malonyltransferase n=2 Tax=Paenibacillus mucilaginosus TaxID=61624 RepID=F8FQZ4_PAEMK|nr:ACP S-malonyltransferase [Paenibacillus mucilaginosus]AEI40432.1 PksE [Paenibacillus mucilaginosus KNP414]MCG7213223.1 ACP S-malonyltransferase [Paenibacillus mucilaginosus]WDM29611.1 ACP S-malonyltransferase [Paenibacillus mucilaginosus]